MREARKRVVLPTEFRAGGRSSRGKVKNVSAGGLFVHTEEIPELGETVRLCMTPARGRRLELTGMVWWTTREAPHSRSRGFGLRVLEDNSAFLEFVDRLR